MLIEKGVKKTKDQTKMKPNRKKTPAKQADRQTNKETYNPN